jgi:hypothetical protein
VGNKYANHSVKTADQKLVAEVMRRARRVAFVSRPQNGYVVVYDQEVDELGTPAVVQVGALLSKEIGVPVLCVLNYDDDILCYWLFEQGKLIDEFNSRPDYFNEVKGTPAQGGDVERLCTSLGTNAERAKVEELLRGKHLFAVDQHTELAKELGLPSCSVGLGYDYVKDLVTAGEELEEDEYDLAPSQLIRTP